MLLLCYNKKNTQEKCFMNDEIVTILKNSELYQQALALAASTYDIFEKSTATKNLQEKGFILQKESSHIKTFIDPKTQTKFFKNANEISFVNNKKAADVLGIICVVLEKTDSGFLPKRMIAKKERLVPVLKLGFIEIMPVFHFENGLLNSVNIDIKSFNRSMSSAFNSPEKITLMFSNDDKVDRTRNFPAQKSDFFKDLDFFFFLVHYVEDTTLTKALLNYMILGKEFPTEKKEIISIMYEININDIKALRYVKNDIKESEKNKSGIQLKI